MNPDVSLIRSSRLPLRRVLAVVCATLLLSWEAGWSSQNPPTQDPPQAAAEQEAPKIPPEQLDALVAPIALYPDPLLSQTLVASTYPLEIIQLQQWLEKNSNLKDKALTDAAMKQPWDASIQAMVVLPDVVKRLAGDIQWTTDLGNAFLAQQGDVMDAVQRMRKKAQDTGALKSTEQQKVETKVVETKTVIVVEPASTEVIYVPTYNPVVVYGPPVYPYPPIYYPPPPPPGAYLGAAMITFGIGMAVGAAWGGHYGWGCGWGHNDININVNNNFNRNTNINRNPGGGGNNWQHNPKHRGGAPYSNKATANKFGGAARGDSMASRQASARQQVSRQGGNVGSSSRGGAGTGAGNRSAGGSNSIGSRSVPQGSGKNKSAFGGGSSGYSGSSARSSSSRGSSSMGRSSRGGGGGGGRRR